MGNTVTYNNNGIKAIISREPNLKRTEVFLYLKVPANHQIELNGVETTVYNRNNQLVTDEEELNEIFNSDKEQYSNYRFESTYKYVFIPNPQLYIPGVNNTFQPTKVFIKLNGDFIEYPFKTKDRWESVDFFLMGTDHALTIITPLGDLSSVNNKNKPSRINKPPRPPK